MKIGFTTDPSIFHFTKFETAERILSSGVLKFSKFADTFDPDEQEPFPDLVRSDGDVDDETSHQLHQTFKREMRRIKSEDAQMLCFTQSYSPIPSNQLVYPTFYKGWRQHAFWAHFAANHSGVAFQFNKQKLLASSQAGNPQFDILFGEVTYQLNSRFSAHPPSVGIRNFQDLGAETVARNLVSRSFYPFLFMKSEAWAYEDEYRLVALSECNHKIYIQIVEALEAVYVSRSSSKAQRKQLLRTLRRYGYAQPLHLVRWESLAYLEEIDFGTSENEKALLTKLQKPVDSCPSGTLCNPHAYPKEDTFDMGMLSYSRETLLRGYIELLSRDVASLCSRYPQLNFSVHKSNGDVGIRIDEHPGSLIQPLSLHFSTRGNDDSCSLVFIGSSAGIIYEELKIDILNSEDDSKLVEIKERLGESVNNALNNYKSAEKEPLSLIKPQGNMRLLSGEPFSMNRLESEEEKLELIPNRLVNVADAKLAIGELFPALSTLLKVFSVDPSHPEAHITLRILHELGNEKTKTKTPEATT